MNDQAPKQFADRFWLLCGGQATSLAGSFAVQFAIIWLLTGTTRAATVPGIRAIGGAIHGPAMLASTSLTVPEEHNVRVQGLNQALLVSWLSMSSILLIDVITALVAVIPLLAAPVAELFGLRFCYIAGGISCMLLAAVASVPAFTGATFNPGAHK